MKVHQIVIPKLSDPITFWCGSNAQNNFDIISQSESSDIWFHIADYPSAHVIARLSLYPNLEQIDRSDKKLMSLIIKQGAVLCKQISKYNSIKNVSITYAQISNIKLTETLGTVSVSLGKNIIV